MVRRAALAVLAAWILAVPGVMAQTPADRLAVVLRLSHVVSIMQAEGLSHAQTLDADMLDGQGGSYFADRVRQIHDPAEMAQIVQKTLATEMSDSDIAASIAFFDTDLGQRILSLENAARVALADPAVEDLASASYAALKGTDDPRLALVSCFVVANDLIGRNVASALDSNYRFYRGLLKGTDALGDFDPLAEAWAQEADMRAETERWVYGFLLMAYQPLQAGELESYLAFSQSAAGQSLNAALFEGFDRMFRSISYRLGLAVARAMGASDI